jgi:Pyridoxamine 5'-phosphate oxidase
MSREDRTTSDHPSPDYCLVVLVVARMDRRPAGQRGGQLQGLRQVVVSLGVRSPDPPSWFSCGGGGRADRGWGARRACPKPMWPVKTWPAGLRSEAMALSTVEREQFLAEPHIGALSVLERPDRAPLTIPIWYQYTPGGDLWVLTTPEARKTQAIHAATRFSLMVQRTRPTARYVSVEGPVVRTATGSEALSREMAARYLPPAKVDDYLEYERTHLGEHIAIYMRPEHWLSSDLGPAW